VVRENSKKISFNGAALFQAQKFNEKLPATQHYRFASMGLRFFKRRNPLKPCKMSKNNEASMGLRFFKRRNKTSRAIAIRIVSLCFNGAALFQAQKWNLISPVKPTVGQLQWGCAFSSAEITRMGFLDVH